jgi:hypothetical protein
MYSSFKNGFLKTAAIENKLRRWVFKTFKPVIRPTVKTVRKAKRGWEELNYKHPKGVARGKFLLGISAAGGAGYTVGKKKDK